MKTATEIESGLAHCYGTEGYHRTLSPRLVHTDGVKTLAEMGECFWLVDAIVSHQSEAMKDDSLRYMQFWKLRKVEDTRSFVLECERDKDDIAISQTIEYSDFPLDEVSIWVERGSIDGINPMMVMMLPSEH